MYSNSVTKQRQNGTVEEGKCCHTKQRDNKVTEQTDRSENMTRSGDADHKSILKKSRNKNIIQK